MLPIALHPMATVQDDVLGHGVVRVARRGQLVRLDEDAGPPEVDVAPGVIGVEVSVDDYVDLARV